MKKYTYNLNQLIKVEVIDFQHNDSWKFIPERRNIFGYKIKAHWHYIFGLSSRNYKTPELNDGEIIKDNKVFSLPSVKFHFVDNYGFKTYFNSVEEAEKYYLEISKKYLNAVRTK